MYARQATVINRTGLHARPASLFVLEAKKFESIVTIRKVADGSPIDATSILGLMAQGFSQGTEVEIAAEGTDESEAVESLVALLATGFDE